MILTLLSATHPFPPPPPNRRLPPFTAPFPDYPALSHIGGRSPSPSPHRPPTHSSPGFLAPHHPRPFRFNVSVMRFPRARPSHPSLSTTLRPRPRREYGSVTGEGCTNVPPFGGVCYYILCAYIIYSRYIIYIIYTVCVCVWGFYMEISDLSFH